MITDETERARLEGALAFHRRQVEWMDAQLDKLVKETARARCIREQHRRHAAKLEKKLASRK